MMLRILKSLNKKSSKINKLLNVGLGETLSVKEETIPEDTDLSVRDVVDLLEEQNAVITGGKTKEGYPIITLPDLANFSNLLDTDYQKLMTYLTSVPSMHEADLGFALVIDRRNDKWSSVKTTLLKISGFFPGLIHIAYVVRPSGFFQKAISEVSNKFFKEEFKFKVVVCSNVEELHQFIDKSELTKELEGTMQYSHQRWISQRIGLEEFSRQTSSVSGSLDKFTTRLRESPVEPQVGALNSETQDYLALKEEILRTAKGGETLLAHFRLESGPSSLVNITAVERLLVQLEETERTFDEFWAEHSSKLRQAIEIQRFNADYKRTQSVLEADLKAVSESTEIGETVQRMEYLIAEFTALEKACIRDMDQCDEVLSFGRSLLRGRHYWPLESVTVRCEELERACSVLKERLAQRSRSLAKSHQLQITVDQANKWCSHGIDLLGAKHLDNCSCAFDVAQVSLAQLTEFTKTADQFNSLLVEYSTPETKALVSQVLQRIDDVRTMCDKRVVTLRRLVERPPGPTGPEPPAPSVPPPPPSSHDYILSKAANQNHKDETDNSRMTNGVLEKEQEVKRGHVLAELLETERLYVSELGSIVEGYMRAMDDDEFRHLLPLEIQDKRYELFGNLEEIYKFHGDIFLQDLENCISTTELVALCFTHRRDALHKLYSTYCQNIPRSERLRERISDDSFFKACQTRLGHKLPLAAYLLKPVQRITKYQLLIKDLLGYSDGKKWCGELQEALDCMLVVLKCVNDSMHQIAITGYRGDLAALGELLMQGSFSVWSESKKDRLKELRLKPRSRHIFLYRAALLFTKRTALHSKATYHFKRIVKMGEIGLTESVKGDSRRFEIWSPGRSEVHTIQAPSLQAKADWVDQIKALLLEQLTQLKVKQGVKHSGLRAMSLDGGLAKGREEDELASSSDFSNSDDEETFTNQGSRYRVLADYTALSHSELSMKEGDLVSLLKVGCAGWWYVRAFGNTSYGRSDGWVPAAYLELAARKSSRSCHSVTSDTSSQND